MHYPSNPIFLDEITPPADDRDLENNSQDFPELYQIGNGAGADSWSCRRKIFHKITVRRPINEKSKQALLEMLNECFGTVKIEIKIEDSDTFRILKGKLQEKIIDNDLSVDFEIDEEDPLSLSEDNSSFSLESPKKTDQNNVNAEVLFESASDLIILQTQCFNKIRELAYENEVFIRMFENKYLLSGKSEKEVEGVKKFIEKEFNDTLIIEWFQGVSNNNNNVLFNALKQLSKPLKERLKLNHIYFLTSKEYANNCKQVLKKAPELQPIIKEEAEKPCMRILLYQEGIRSNKDMKKKFAQAIHDFHLKIINIQEETSAELTEDQIKQLNQAASQKLFVITNISSPIVPSSTDQFAYNIELYAFYLNKREKTNVEKNIFQLKLQIKEIFNPSLLYYFKTRDHTILYEHFLKSKIEELCQEKNVEISFVKLNESHINKLKEIHTNDALKIKGNRKSINNISHQIEKNMQKYSIDNFYPKYDMRFESILKKKIEKPGKEFFFNQLFNEIYDKFPNNLLVARFEKKNLQKEKDFSIPNQGGESQNSSQGHYNKKPGRSQRNRRLVISTFLNNQDKEYIKQKLEEFFSKLCFSSLNQDLQTLLKKSGKTAGDFQKENNVILVKKKPNSLIGIPKNIQKALIAIQLLENSLDQVQEARFLPTQKSLIPEPECLINIDRYSNDTNSLKEFNENFNNIQEIERNPRNFLFRQEHEVDKKHPHALIHNPLNPEEKKVSSESKFQAGTTLFNKFKNDPSEVNNQKDNFENNQRNNNFAFQNSFSNTNVPKNFLDQNFINSKNQRPENRNQFGQISFNNQNEVYHDSSLIYQPKSKNFEFKLLQENDPKNQLIFKSFNQSLQDRIILNIYQIENNEMHKLFQQEEQKLQEILSSSPEKLFLWYEPQENYPSINSNDYTYLLKEYSNDDNWRKGLRFAENASYFNSDALNDLFVKDQPSKYIILCLVLIERGEPSEEYPLWESNEIRGIRKKFNVYTLYKREATFPYYLVEYK